MTQDPFTSEEALNTIASPSSMEALSLKGELNRGPPCSQVVRGRGKESVGQSNGREKGRAQILGQEFYPGGRKPFHLEISACSYPSVLPRQEAALARWCQGL